MNALKLAIFSCLVSCIAAEGLAQNISECRSVARNAEGYGAIFIVEGVSYRKINEEWGNNDASAYWCQVNSSAAGDGQPDVQLASMVYNGSGCPKDIVPITATLADSNHLTLDLNGMISALMAPGSKLSAAYKSCQVTVQLNYPQGWTFAVSGADYQGGVYLEEKTAAVINQIYYFTGATASATSAINLVGPYSDTFDGVGVVASDLFFAPCDQNLPLNIKTEEHIRSDDRSATGIAAFNQVSTVKLIWQRCQ